MKIVVIGGTGLVGSKVTSKLADDGHESVAASPDTGVNTLTGEGLDAVLAGADVVVDLSNSPSFADQDVLDFFTTSTTNLMKAESVAGVGHHVALSIVNNDRIPDSGYMRAKVAQERIIRESGNEYCIVRATQFFEFTRSIAQAATVDGIVRLPAVAFQPIAAEDVARVVARMAVGKPINGVLDIAGPTRYRFNEFIAQALTALGEPAEVVADEHARYFGTELQQLSLVPGDGAELGSITFEDWLTHQAVK